MPLFSGISALAGGQIQAALRLPHAPGPAVRQKRVFQNRAPVRQGEVPLRPALRFDHRNGAPGPGTTGQGGKAPLRRSEDGLGIGTVPLPENLSGLRARNLNGIRRIEPHGRDAFPVSFHPGQEAPVRRKQFSLQNGGLNGTRLPWGFRILRSFLLQGSRFP